MTRCRLVACAARAVVAVRHPYRPEAVTVLCEHHGEHAAAVGGVIVREGSTA